MNILLTESEPATDPLSRGGNPALPNTVIAGRLTAVEPPTRVLYVDDDVEARGFGERVLVRSGYEVDTAADGAAAWEALHHGDYHLLISENQMPRLTGAELIPMVHLWRPGVLVILASSSVSSLPVDDPLRLECEAMLAKPFTAERLMGTVREVLGTARSVRVPAGARLPVGVGFHRQLEPCRDWGINE